MDSWWELGEGMGYFGNKLELWRIACAFCGEKGQFSLAYHGEKKKPTSDKRLNFDVYKCNNCAGFVHVFWSASEFASMSGGLYGYKILPWPLMGKPEPSKNWPDGMKRFWVQVPGQSGGCCSPENGEARRRICIMQVRGSLKMSKQKGRFAKGKYIDTPTAHIKAKRDKGGTHFDITIRLSVDNVRQTLKPQIEKFLSELNKQPGLRKTAARAGK